MTFGTKQLWISQQDPDSKASSRPLRRSPSVIEIFDSDEETNLENNRGYASDKDVRSASPEPPRRVLSDKAKGKQRAIVEVSSFDDSLQYIK